MPERINRMAEFDDAFELSSFWNLEASIVRELVDRRQVHVFPVDNDHAAGGRSAFFADETFQIRNEVVEGEEIRRFAVDNIVFFAVGVLQKELLVDGYEVGPVQLGDQAARGPRHCTPPGYVPRRALDA